MNLFATQQMQEEDSFDNTYDEKAGWMGEADTAWYNDTDTEFVINTAEELAGLAKLVNEGNSFAKKTVKLGEDINLGGATWTPIGTKAAPFKGTFDGQGKTISNMKVAMGEGSYAGLFGYINGGGTVKGVNMKNVEASGYSYAGSIAGRVYTGTIEDCHVTGTVKITSQYAYAGGIVGGDYVQLRNCSVLADDGQITVKEKTGAGGICGWHTEGDYQLDNLHVKNLKITAWGNVGGIFGFIHYGNALTNSSAEDIVLTKTRVDGHSSIGLAAGGWSYSASNPITITNNTFKNIELNGNYVAFSSANILYGSEYGGNANSNFVLDNNTQENITNNLVEVVKVSSAQALAEAVAAGATNIVLADGEYDVYGCGGKTLTLTGSKKAVIKLYNEGEDGCDYAFGPAVGDVTFVGLTIDTTSNTGNYKGFAYMKGTFVDCDFVGAYSLNNANDFVFKNCTFDLKNGYFWTWGANSVTFDGCTFNGNSKAILAHGGSSTVININNCTFAATEKGYTGSGDNTAVVEIDPVGSNTYTINFTGENTITDSYAGWTRIKDGSTGHTITGLE